MLKTTKLVSKLDQSVNFITPFKSSIIESRYIRRADNYISAYLSSHNGCNMGCKFCWLTASKQTTFNHVSNDLYAQQLDKILEHAKSIDNENSKNVRVNVNLMSRGEPLANKYLVNKYDDFFNNLNDVIKRYDYKEQKINISTIMPYTIEDRELIDIFRDNPAYLYYSMYSTDQQFRDEWIPNSLPWIYALDKLRNYQKHSDLPITIHFALIDKHNDDIDEVKRMAEMIDSYNFNKLKFNIVKFNPHPSMNKYKEASQEKQEEILKILKQIAKDEVIKTNKTRIVQRVGYDVYGSCGMFYE